jgi:uncharacterized protein GlcG (DUF336 family)
MPPPPVTAAIVEKSAEAATATQAFEGAVVTVQFVWPKAEAAAIQRLPTAVVKKRRNLLFRITLIPAAICASALINRLSPGPENLNLTHF